MQARFGHRKKSMHVMQGGCVMTKVINVEAKLKLESGRIYVAGDGRIYIGLGVTRADKFLLYRIGYMDNVAYQAFADKAKVQLPMYADMQEDIATMVHAAMTTPASAPLFLTLERTHTNGGAPAAVLVPLPNTRRKLEATKVIVGMKAVQVTLTR